MMSTSSGDNLGGPQNEVRAFGHSKFVDPPVPSVFRQRLKRVADNAIAEGVNTLFFILLLAGARWLVEHLFNQSKFFDSVPVRYLFDVGDIAIIGRFIWNTIKGED